MTVPQIDLNDNITDSNSFKVKARTTPAASDTTDVEIMVPLKYLRNFLRTLQMLLINYETNLILTWPANCIITKATTNQYLLFRLNNTKLLKELKSRTMNKGTVNWNKCQSTVTAHTPN